MNMKMRSLFFLVLLLSAIGSVAAQTATGVVGIVLESPANTPLTGVSVLARVAGDTTKAARGASSDENGRFKIENLSAGLYELELSYLGYERIVVRNLLLEAGKIYPLDTVKMRPTSQDLGIVEVEARAIRVELLGDTVQFNAAAFKTRENAVLEDLLKKMPGMSVGSDGSIKFNGQPIENITINGQDLFEGDTKTPNKTLPADFVDKIQVFDANANPNGIKDGEGNKTINVVTKESASPLQAGKLSAAGGSDTDTLQIRYQAGGNFTFLGGDRNIVASFGGNNISLPEMSTDDAIGAFVEQTSQQMDFSANPRSMQQMGIMGSYTVGNEGILDMFGGGINYSDKWGKKLKITTSYYFVNTRNVEDTEKEQRFFEPAGGFGQRYKEQRDALLRGYSHRVKLTLNWDLDSLSKLTLSTRASFGGGRGTQDFVGENFGSEGDRLNQLSSLQRRSTGHLNTNSSLRYNRKFAKARRNLTVEIAANSTNGDSRNLQISDFDASSLQQLNQLQRQVGSMLNASGEATYTEPLDSQSLLEFSYSQNYSRQNSDWQTNQFSPTENEYSDFDTLLSTQWESEFFRSRPRIRYQYNSKDQKISFNTSVAYQYALLRGEQRFPYSDSIYRPFHNFLPNLNLNYKFNKKLSLRLNYGAHTVAPTLQQLQRVVNNRNPLFLFAGNSELRQSYGHWLGGGLNFIDPKKGSSVFLNVHASATQQYIGFSTFIAANDTILSDGSRLSKGAQFAQFVNLGTAYSLSNYLSVNIPIEKLGGELGISGGLGFMYLPTRLNGQEGRSLNINPNFGVYYEGEIGEWLEIGLSTDINTQHTRNAFSNQRNVFLTFNNGANVEVHASKSLSFSANLWHNSNKGFGDGFSQNIFILGGDMSYSFLKNRRAVLKLSVYDLLNQNNRLQRNVSDIYIEDLRTRALRRYVMLHFSYNFRPETKESDDMIFFMPG